MNYPGILTERDKDGEEAMTRDEIQREYAGNWVAVRDGKVVEAWENPYGLVQRLRERMIDDATIVRCPAASEPQLVGLG